MCIGVKEKRSYVTIVLYIDEWYICSLCRNIMDTFKQYILKWKIFFRLMHSRVIPLYIDKADILHGSNFFQII